MTNTNSPDIPRSGRFHAMVRAGASVTAYVRTGNGKPVILLRATQHQAGLWELVLEQLSRRFRVIVPELSPDPAMLNEWFVAFHDGLGIGAASLVLDDSYAAAAIRLTLEHGSRVDRIVFISQCANDSAEVGMLSEMVSNQSHALFVVAEHAPQETVARRVEEFLKTDEAALPLYQPQQQQNLA